MRTSDISLMLARTNILTNTRLTDDRRRWDAITLMWLHYNTYYDNVLGYSIPTPNHCLNQCRLINNWNLRKKIHMKMKMVYVPKTVYNTTCKKVTTLFKSQCIKRYLVCGNMQCNRWQLIELTNDNDGAVFHCHGMFLRLFVSTIRYDPVNWG